MFIKIEKTKESYEKFIEVYVNCDSWCYKKDSIREMYSYDSFICDLKDIDYYIYYLKKINDKYEFITIAIGSYNTLKIRNEEKYKVYLRYEKLNVLEGFQIG
jgi:hypothetical protein